MYEKTGASRAERVTLAAVAALCAASAGWLLLGGGLEVVGGWLGRTWKPGEFLRRICLAAALAVYFIRVLFTVFVFLKRAVTWSEVFTIAPWLLCLYLLAAISGGRNAAAFGAASIAGGVLFILGSWMNSFAEYARHRWKLRPENRGRLYTGGLFRHSRHPNYLGDLLSFSGLCLIAGKWVTVAIPLFMLAGFVFVNIPALDAHLSQKYGSQFDQYAARSWKLIPFVY